jgi:predicted outer membrane protein
MKALLLLAGALFLALARAEAAPQKPKAKGGPYPRIIQMTPPGGAPAGASGKLISSEIGGLDLRFLREATVAGLLQGYLGELAKTKGSTEQVRKVGETLAATPEENTLLAQLAARKGVSVPTDPATVRARLVGDFETLEGLHFDKALLEQLLAVNRLAVAACEAGAASQDADIKAFVAQMLPVAKARLQHTSKMAGAPARPSGIPSFRLSFPPADR